MQAVANADGDPFLPNKVKEKGGYIDAGNKIRQPG
jgi:hypothetical protein